MGRLRAPAVLLGLLVLSFVPAAAQEPPRLPQEFPLVGDVFNQAWDAAAPVLENETAEDLRTEEIALDVVLDISNADVSLVQILFGGGKVEAAATARLGADFHAVSVSRLDAALQAATGDANVSLNQTFGIASERVALTAEEIRVAGGGVLLEAFQAFQEGATKRFIESLLPGVTVLEADFQWSNVLPFAHAREQDYRFPLRDPPIRLDAKIGLEYLERYSAVEIFQLVKESQNRTAEEEERKRLQERIEEHQTVPPAERNAFMYLGYSQLIDLQLPVGWRLNLTLAVPKGYTVEAVTQELVLDEEHRGASYFVDGSNRSAPLEAAGVATVSNRFAVTTFLLGALFLVGFIGRVVVEAAVLGAMALWHRLARRKRAPAAHYAA